MTAQTTTAATTTTTEQRDERRRRRAAIVKFSLAGAAVLGIGAAATSAVWTDDAWFSASATAVDPDTAIDLRGAFNPAEPGTAPALDAFTEADTLGAAVAIPASVFADLTAGDSVTTTVWIHNAGTADLQIAEPDVVTTGGLFAPGGATVDLGTAPSALAADSAPSPVTVTIALPETADREVFGGADGSVTIQFQGTIATRS